MRDRGWRAWCLIVIAERPANPQCGDSQGKIHAANAGTLDRGNLDAPRAFFDDSGIQARDFRTMPPRLTFPGEVMAAARERDQYGNDGGRQRTLNTRRHNAENAWVSVKDCSMWQWAARWAEEPVNHAIAAAVLIQAGL